VNQEYVDWLKGQISKGVKLRNKYKKDKPSDIEEFAKVMVVLSEVYGDGRDPSDIKKEVYFLQLLDYQPEGVVCFRRPLFYPDVQVGFPRLGGNVFGEDERSLCLQFFGCYFFTGKGRCFFLFLFLFLFLFATQILETTWILYRYCFQTVPKLF